MCVNEIGGWGVLNLASPRPRGLIMGCPRPGFSCRPLPVPPPPWQAPSLLLEGLDPSCVLPLSPTSHAPPVSVLLEIRESRNHPRGAPSLSPSRDLHPGYRGRGSLLPINSLSLPGSCPTVSPHRRENQSVVHHEITLMTPVPATRLAGTETKHKPKQGNDHPQRKGPLAQGHTASNAPAGNPLPLFLAHCSPLRPAAPQS